MNEDFVLLCAKKINVELIEYLSIKYIVVVYQSNCGYIIELHDK